LFLLAKNLSRLKKKHDMLTQPQESERRSRKYTFLSKARKSRTSSLQSNLVLPQAQEELRHTSFFQTVHPAIQEVVFDPFATNKTPRFEVDTKRSDTLEDAEVKIHRLGMSPTEHNRLLFGRRKYSSSDEGS